MRRRKIIYIIATFGHGQGGHFRDLREISSEQSKTADCLILNIGPARSMVLEEGIVRVENIDTKIYSVFGVIARMRKIFAEEKPDVVNLFDLRVYFFSYLLRALSSAPMIVTKCGGGNPKRFFPVSDGLVVFSRENLIHFSVSDSKRNGALLLLPNRVRAPKQNVELIEEIQSRTNLDGVGVILIGRMTQAYRQTMISAIGLVKRLNLEGSACHLYLIGVPEDPGVVQEIESLINQHVCLLTDDRYTKDAAQLLDLAEISISSGRGLMEAAALGKILVTSIQGESVPALVDEGTFEKLFSTNFSPRNSLVGSDPAQRYGLISSAVRSAEVRADYSRQSRAFFETYFDVTGVAEAYDKFYDSVVRRGSFSLTSFFWGFLSYQRSRDEI